MNTRFVFWLMAFTWNSNDVVHWGWRELLFVCFGRERRTTASAKKSDQIILSLVASREHSSWRNGRLIFPLNSAQAEDLETRTGRKTAARIFLFSSVIELPHDNRCRIWVWFCHFRAGSTCERKKFEIFHANTPPPPLARVLGNQTVNFAIQFYFVVDFSLSLSRSTLAPYNIISISSLVASSKTSKTTAEEL